MPHTAYLPQLLAQVLSSNTEVSTITKTSQNMWFVAYSE